MSRIREKLKSQKGESIGEVLIALLIACLGILMLSSMIAASSKLVIQNRKTMKDYYEANNPLEVQDSGGNQATATLTVNGSSVSYVSYSVLYFSNEKSIGDTEVISYVKSDTTNNSAGAGTGANADNNSGG